MTDKNEIISKLNAYIVTELLKRPDKTIGADDALISGGLIDSFSLVDLALFVEQSWGARIDDTELNTETFDSLGQLADLIAARANS